MSIQTRISKAISSEILVLKNEIRSKRVEIFIALLGIVVGSLIIPSIINANANSRAATIACFDSAVALQGKLNQVVRGYAIQPKIRQERLLDLDAMYLSLETVGYSCRESNLPVERMNQIGEFSAAFQNQRQNASVDNYDSAFTDRLLGWTKDAIQDIRR